MDDTPTSPEEIAVESEHRRTAEALARAVREAAAQLLPFGLEPQDFTAALERLAEPGSGEGDRP